MTVFLRQQPTIEVATSGDHPPRMLVIVLHGGRAWGYGGAHRGRLAYLRMLPFSWLWRGDNTVVVWRLRYRHRGWNGAESHPLRDIQWALRQATIEHPDATLVLIGHSMGGRAALLGASARVNAICALAPWLEPGDPVDQLRGKNIHIAHGDRDYVTSARASRDYAARARHAGANISFTSMMGQGHTMLRSPRTWNALVTSFIARQHTSQRRRHGGP